MTVNSEHASIHTDTETLIQVWVWMYWYDWLSFTIHWSQKNLSHQLERKEKCIHDENEWIHEYSETKMTIWCYRLILFGWNLTTWSNKNDMKSWLCPRVERQREAKARVEWVNHQNSRESMWPLFRSCGAQSNRTSFSRTNLLSLVHRDTRRVY